MEFRLAVMDDLKQLNNMYKQIVKNMKDHKLNIWSDTYPFEFLENDIRNHQMYLLIDNDEIISSFVLCKTADGEKYVQWKNNLGKAVYLHRLGVNIKYENKGIGTLMVKKAKEVAKSLGNEYLRLFVVDINIPAIQLYVKNGFIKAKGAYDQVFDDDLILHEYGYEIEV